MQTPPENWQIRNSPAAQQLKQRADFPRIEFHFELPPVVQPDGADHLQGQCELFRSSQFRDRPVRRRLNQTGRQPIRPPNQSTRNCRFSRHGVNRNSPLAAKPIASG